MAVMHGYGERYNTILQQAWSMVAIEVLRQHLRNLYDYTVLGQLRLLRWSAAHAMNNNEGCGIPHFSHHLCSNVTNCCCSGRCICDEAIDMQSSMH